MSRAATLARPSFVFSQPVKTSTKAKINRPVSAAQKWTAYGLAAANILLLAAYLFGVNSNAAAGYEIKKLQTQVSGLNETSKQLLVQMSERSSIADIQNQSVKQDFVPVAGAKFLQISHYSYK